MTAAAELAALPLSEVEADTLATHEATIRAGLDTFVQVGTALAAIRDDRLYRTTHGTFEDYCAERWSLARSRAYQLIDAAAVTDLVSTMVDTPAPSSERQARPLTKLRDEPEAIRSAWSRAVESAPRDDQGAPKVTAALVESAVRDELAARRDQIQAVKQQAEQDQAEVAEFNAATAHLVPQAERERPWSLAAIAVSRAVEHLPLDTDPDELASNVPDHSAYRLDALDDRVMAWLVRLFSAHHVPNCTACPGGHP